MLIVDVTPIPRFVDLVHASNGVLLVYSKQRLEKLLSDSILLWRLLLLLFKFLQYYSKELLVGTFLKNSSSFVDIRI